MSYEGFVEFIAEDGSYFTQDAYDEDPNPVSPETGSPARWWHAVDCTNGVVLDDDATMPADKDRIGSLDVWRTDHHGNRYAVLVPLYRPAGREGLWQAVDPKSRREEPWG